jgi:hypothetical protein
LSQRRSRNGNSGLRRGWGEGTSGHRWGEGGPGVLIPRRPGGLATCGLRSPRMWVTERTVRHGNEGHRRLCRGGRVSNRRLVLSRRLAQSIRAQRIVTEWASRNTGSGRSVEPDPATLDAPGFSFPLVEPGGAGSGPPLATYAPSEISTIAIQSMVEGHSPKIGIAMRPLAAGFKATNAAPRIVPRMPISARKAQVAPTLLAITSAVCPIRISFRPGRLNWANSFGPQHGSPDRPHAQITTVHAHRTPCAPWAECSPSLSSRLRPLVSNAKKKSLIPLSSKLAPKSPKPEYLLPYIRMTFCT